MNKLLEIANRLTGREIGDEMKEGVEKYAKENGVVILFGASDDLVELRGAINDEEGCYDGGVFHLAPDGIVDEYECEERCDYFLKFLNAQKTIETVWCDKELDIDWTYKTDIPHETFDILEDDRIYCRGIVFYLSDLVGDSK